MFIIGSSLTGKYLYKVGRERALILGMLLIVIGIVALGLIYLVDERTTFVLVSFLAKALLGVGGGMNATAIISIIATNYKDEREKYLG